MAHVRTDLNIGSEPAAVLPEAGNTSPCGETGSRRTGGGPIWRPSAPVSWIDTDIGRTKNAPARSVSPNFERMTKITTNVDPWTKVDGGCCLAFHL
jgi:hypothetical protein